MYASTSAVKLVDWLVTPGNIEAHKRPSLCKDFMVSSGVKFRYFRDALSACYRCSGAHGLVRRCARPATCRAALPVRLRLWPWVSAFRQQCPCRASRSTHLRGKLAGPANVRAGSLLPRALCTCCDADRLRLWIQSAPGPTCLPRGKALAALAPALLATCG